MAGLDTRGLADGFVQGFGLMNQYQRGQAADRRADQQLQMHRENAKWQREHGERRFGLAEQQLEHSINHADRQFGLSERQFEHNVNHADRQFGLQQQRMGMEQQRLNIQQAARQREEENARIEFALGKMTRGMDLDEGEIDLLKSRPEVWAGLDPQSDAAIMRAVEIFDPNTPADANDPESLEAANLLFADLINRGEGGQKRIAGWYPGPDGESLVLELEVTREDGSVYRAPMTEGRGTEEDAVVKTVPIEDLANHLHGLRMLRNTFNSSPEGQQKAAQMLQVLRGDPVQQSGMTQSRLDGILDQYTKDQMSIITDEAIMDPADRQSRLDELDAVYARNLGVSRDTLSAAREYAESEGISLSPQLIQAVQQEMYQLSASRSEEVAAEEPSTLEEQAQVRQESRSEVRAQRARTREIDDTLAGIVDQISELHSPVANLPGIGPGVPGVGGQAIPPEQIQAAIDQIESMRPEFTPRQEARAARIVEQLHSFR